MFSDVRMGVVHVGVVASTVLHIMHRQNYIMDASVRYEELRIGVTMRVTL